MINFVYLFIFIFFINFEVSCYAREGRIVVSSRVKPAVKITVGDLNFGEYNPEDTNDKLGFTEMKIEIPVGINFIVGLDGGSTTNDVNNRQMKGNKEPADRLRYQLYKSDNSVWGLGHQAYKHRGSVASEGFETITILATGRILSSQDTMGNSTSFSDTINIIFNFVM